MYSLKYHKLLLLFSMLLLTTTLAVGGTLAYFTDTTPVLVNTFVPSRVTTDVDETLDGTVKSQVMLQNTGNTPAYIRSAISVTYTDASGYIHSRTPVLGQDYTLELDTEHGWVLGADGFYYWSYPVLPASTDPENCSTGVLICACSPLSDAPKGFSLNLQIVGSGIQSQPVQAVTQSWSSGVSGVSDTGVLQIRGGEGL